MVSSLNHRKVSTIDEISELLSQANDTLRPIHTTVTAESGTSLDRSNMNKIHKIDSKNFFALIDWGVTFKQLKKELDSRNLTMQYPIESRSNSILENFSNLNAIIGNSRHKVNQIANLVILLPNGQLYQTGASSLTENNYWREDGGPNINRIFLGSDESFGIIIRGTIFLYPKIEKVLVGVEFENFDHMIASAKDLARFNYGEEILLLNRESMKERLGDEIDKEWCLLITFNKKYYDYEGSNFSRNQKFENLFANKSSAEFIAKFEQNWRDFPTLNKVSFYSLLQDCSSLYELFRNRINSFRCEMVPIEGGRTIFSQYFFNSDSKKRDQILKELMDSNICILREINKQTLKIMEENLAYYETARQIKQLFDKNNILNPKPWLGVK